MISLICLSEERPLSALFVASNSSSLFSATAAVAEGSLNALSAILKCAFVGGLNDESRTKSCFTADSGAGVAMRVCSSVVSGEDMKRRMVARRPGRRRAMAAMSRGEAVEAVEAGEVEVMLWWG